MDFTFDEVQEDLRSLSETIVAKEATVERLFGPRVSFRSLQS